MAILPNRGNNTPYTSFQGRVLVAARNLPDDTDGTNLIAPISGFQFLGNVDKFDYSFNTETEIIKDNYTGLRQPDFTAIFGTEAVFDLSLYGFTEFAMSMAHRGIYQAIPSGNTTNASLLRLDRGTNRYFKVATAPTLNANYFLGYRSGGEWKPYRNLKLSTLVVNDSTAVTPKTLVENTNFKVYPRQGRIVFTDLTTGGPYTAPILGSTDFGTVTVELPRNPVFGLEYGLGVANITAFTLKDSAGTPATVDPAYYTLDPVYGTIKFSLSQLTAMEAETYVEPLIATFDHGAQRHMSIMTAPLDREYWVRFQGVNTFDDNNPVMFDFYRVKFQETTNSSLIHERAGKLNLRATALADTRMPEDSIMGQFGQMITY